MNKYKKIMIAGDEFLVKGKKVYRLMSPDTYYLMGLDEEITKRKRKK